MTLLFHQQYSKSINVFIKRKFSLKITANLGGGGQIRDQSSTICFQKVQVPEINKSFAEEALLSSLNNFLFVVPPFCLQLHTSLPNPGCTLTTGQCSGQKAKNAKRNHFQINSELKGTISVGFPIFHSLWYPCHHRSSHEDAQLNPQRKAFSPTASRRVSWHNLYNIFIPQPLARHMFFFSLQIQRLPLKHTWQRTEDDLKEDTTSRLEHCIHF